MVTDGSWGSHFPLGKGGIVSLLLYTTAILLRASCFVFVLLFGGSRAVPQNLKPLRLRKKKRSVD